jgi:hypothetical protein
MSQLLKKITIKQMGIGKDDLLRMSMPEKGQAPKDVAVARVYGVITSTEDKLSEFGPYVLFKGMFEAVNLITGASFKSGLCILQGPVEGFLAGRVAMGGEGAQAPFVAEIGVRYMPDAKGSPYLFTGKLIGEESTMTNDPLKALRALAMGEAAPALESPKKK